MPKQIQIYDTTLRDGSQSEDISFTVEDKLRIAEKLDWLGVHYIEAGWPGASPKDTEFFRLAKKELKLKKSKLVAFGSTRKADNEAAHDKILNDLLESEAKIMCLFGKTWDLHVKKTLGISLTDNLELIFDSVAYLKKNKRQVFFDAEHFFDGYKANKKFALAGLKAAAKGGADVLVLCDTNGGTLPDEIEKIIKDVKKQVRVPLGIHCHNDTGMAVANSMTAVKNGVVQVQGTINGIGERCGNANLCTIMANLELKWNIKTVGGTKLKNLKEVSTFVDEMANRQPVGSQPYVGQSAFAHKGGVHVHAILKDARTYEHVQPQKVGNRQRILISELSGKATVAHKAQEFGLPVDSSSTEILTMLKDLESQGYQFEGAEASLEILIKKARNIYSPHFELIDFRVTDEILPGLTDSPTSEAFIHLKVEDHTESTSAKGVGPVHAIDQALRKALERFYPNLKELKLLDYKVRVLPAGSGTAAVVRVLIESGDGKTKWGTVGVSENIIHASYKALVDSIDYKLLKDKK